jgi:type II secretion system protein N
VTQEIAAPSGAERLVDGLRGLGTRLVSGTPGLRTPVVAYALFTLLLFVLCFVAMFPHDLLLQRALTRATAGMPVRVEAGRGSLGWSLAYAIESLRVGARDGDAEPYLSAEALRIAPSRFGLLRGNPYPVGIDAALYGGTLRGSIDPRPASFVVAATLDGVDLARYGGLRPWLDGSLRGKLEGAIALDGGGRGPAAANGTVRLRVGGLALEGGKIRGITVPDLHFTDVHVNGTVKNGRLEVDEVVADGDEITVRGDGDVLLRDPLGSSMMSLELVVAPAAGAPDGLKLAVNMLPGAKAEGGARRIMLVGTLARPTVR